ncbi:MAG: hypothetical protein ABSG22_12365 [Sedimentisphaerales bacterium]
MKKKIVLLVILVVGFAAGNVLANALMNPGFEQGDLGRFGGPPIQGWTTYGTNGEHHSDANAVHSGTKAVKEWLDDTGIFQDFPVVANNTYDLSIWAIALSSDGGGLYGRDAFFKVEWYDVDGVLIYGEVIGYFYADPSPPIPPVPSGSLDPCDIWKFISATRDAPFPAVTCRVFMGMTAGSIGPDAHIGSINWDDVSVTYRYGASNPEPTNGELNLLPFEVTALSWNRPAPRHTGDIIRCDVWFGTDPCMPGTNTKILNKQDANSVAISSLASYQNYYWRVDCYDPDGSGPEIKSEGWTWTFNMADNCGLSYMPGDINKDCYVDFADFAEMAANWRKCNDVSNPQCQ